MTHRPLPARRLRVGRLALALLCLCGFLSATAARAQFTFAYAFGGPGGNPGELNSPRGLAVDPSGNVYVVDQQNDRVQKFSNGGALLSVIGAGGAPPETLANPFGVAAGSGGIYVIDSNNIRVARFDGAGAYGGDLLGIPYLTQPMAIATDSQGNIYVSNLESPVDTIYKVDSSGTILSTLQDGAHYLGVSGLAVGPNDELYVLDPYSGQVVVYDSAGNYLSAFGQPGSGYGLFSNPLAIAVDGQSHVFVANFDGNPAFENIYEFAPNGTLLGTVGSSGPGFNQFMGPTGLAVDGAGKVFVSDYLNSRVVVYARVPEPGMAAMLIGPTVGALVFARRRRKA